MVATSSISSRIIARQSTRRSSGVSPSRCIPVAARRFCNLSPMPRQDVGLYSNWNSKRGVSMIAAADQHNGKVVQVIGSTFDAEFDEGHLPEIYNACKVEDEYK